MSSLDGSPERPSRLGAARRMLAHGLLFFLVYGFSNWHASTLDAVPSLHFEWERHIPFVAWLVVPYMSIDLLFALAFFRCESRDELRVLGRRLRFAMTVSVLCFLTVPLRVAFERPTTDGLPGVLFGLSLIHI